MARRGQPSLKHELIAQEIPIYGVTTGFGDSAHRQISPPRPRKLQQNIMRFMGVRHGADRAARGRARDDAAARQLPVEGQLGRPRGARSSACSTCSTTTSLPFIPERGSCGASGDLAPLSYVGRALAGDGEVAVRRRSQRAASDVLAELGLEPFLLEAKEGLALTNGTSFMSAFACLAVGAASELADLADL